MTIEKINGSGHVDLHVPRLLLLPGTYDISTALTDNEILHIFDFRQRALAVRRRPGRTPRELRRRHLARRRVALAT